jgi:hypothetical protein
VEFGYETRVVNYMFDTTNDTVSALLANYNEAVEERWKESNLNEAVEENDSSIIDFYNTNIKESYSMYLKALQDALDEYKKVNSIE